MDPNSNRGDRVALPSFLLSWPEKYSHSTLSMLVSCIVHTSLLIGLALIYVASRPDEQAVVLQATIAGAEELSLEYSPLPNLELDASEVPMASAPQTDELNLNINAQLMRTEQTLNATLTSALSSIANSPGSSGGIGGGAGGAGESLSKLGANFFGSYATGQTFVFVLDCSKSMTGDRWVYACQELLDSIKRLEPNQKFFVICFDDKTTPMFSTPVSRMKFESNTVELRMRLKRWLATRKLGPGTFPATAITMALQMHPDAIFLLSDGELQDETLYILRDINGFSPERRQIPIHTVHLMSDDGRETLKAIAMENSGTFTPVVGGGSF